MQMLLRRLHELNIAIEFNKTFIIPLSSLPKLLWWVPIPITDFLFEIRLVLSIDFNFFYIQSGIDEFL